MDVTNLSNKLYPVFLNLEHLKILIVGGGKVGLEKLQFLFKSSPNARVTIIAPFLSFQTIRFVESFSGQIKIRKRRFQKEDLNDVDIVIAATNCRKINVHIHRLAKKHRILINVADTPDLCDFYMGSIFSRGDLKIAISTNGKSPTFSKRFRQLLELLIPPESNNLINNLKIIRDRLSGNFEFKVKELNRITLSLIEEKPS